MSTAACLIKGGLSGALREVNVKGSKSGGSDMALRFLLIAALAPSAGFAVAGDPPDTSEAAEAIKEPAEAIEALVFPPETKPCEASEAEQDEKSACPPPQPPATPFDTLAFPAYDPPEDEPLPEG